MNGSPYRKKSAVYIEQYLSVSLPTGDNSPVLSAILTLPLYCLQTLFYSSVTD